MENESGAKIAIRGKGSVKEGKGKSDAAHASNQDEDLHCLIMADTEDKVNKAKKLIHNVIETVCSTPCLSISSSTDTSQAASIPEGQNELKRNQLRELAALNGTLRDDENQACQNCGEIGHRKYDCPQARNFTANIICRVCGNAGHMARDCPDRAKGTDMRNGPPRPAVGGPEDEYERLMLELGGGGGGGGAAPALPKQIGYEQGGAQNGGGDNARPWQKGPTGAPAPWANRAEPTGGPAPWANRQQPTGGPAPWANRGGQDNYGGNGGYGGGGGGYGGGYNAGPPSGGMAPWQQQQQQQHHQNGRQDYGAPRQAPWQSNAPPPPPRDDIPPPPPSDIPPPPPPA